MTQAFNLSQFANKVNTSGQASLTTAVTGILPVANGGTNNGSLTVTAGGTLYTDGSKVVNVGAGTTGQYLKSNGASAPAWATLSSSGGLININYYTTAGTATYTKATNNPSFIVVEVIGAGGGGGGGYFVLGVTRRGAGGGGGGYARRKIAASSLASSETVTIGAGAAGGSNNAVGGTGGTSSFGTFASATGGTGGGNAFSQNGGTGGVGSSGDLNLNGGNGTNSVNVANGGGGVGGSSIFGFGSSDNATVASMPPGSAGTGKGDSNSVSGNGIVIVYEYS